MRKAPTTTLACGKTPCQTGYRVARSTQRMFFFFTTAPAPQASEGVALKKHGSKSLPYPDNTQPSRSDNTTTSRSEPHRKGQHLKTHHETETAEVHKRQEQQLNNSNRTACWSSQFPTAHTNYVRSWHNPSKLPIRTVAVRPRLVIMWKWMSRPSRATRPTMSTSLGCYNPENIRNTKKRGGLSFQPFDHRDLFKHVQLELRQFRWSFCQRENVSCALKKRSHCGAEHQAG